VAAVLGCAAQIVHHGICQDVLDKVRVHASTCEKQVESNR
jgi:hypothetical protein